MTTTKIDAARRLSIAEAAARLKARAKPQTSAPLSSTAMPKDPDSILREVFRLPSFKGRQKEVIDAILAGKDAFYVCPTGEGKSLCYQIPAVAKAPDLTVVVSPLKALMNDQVEKLTACGVAVATYHSDMSETDRVATLRRVRSGEITVLLVSPERLSTEEMLSTITSRKVGLVTIDEAHCVSLWGHDFRISYLNLGNAIERISKSQGQRPPVLLLSATAPAHIRKDVKEVLDIADLAEVVMPPLRKNLTLELREISLVANELENRTAEVIGIARSKPKERTVVYCNTVRETEAVCQALKKAGVNAVHYHGQMSGAYRENFLGEFIGRKANVICCTSAFGMGVDIPDIRNVIHFRKPFSLEDYYQQVGRAGRDGKKAHCVLLFTQYDRHLSSGDLVRVNISLKSVARLYAQIYGWRARQLELNKGREVRFSLPIVIDRIKGSPMRTGSGRLEEGDRFVEAVQLASLGFLIDNGYVTIASNQDLEFPCSPDKLHINYELLRSGEIAQWARADALCTFLKIPDHDGRMKFLADYLTNTIESVMSKYPSTLEMIDRSIVDLVTSHPGLTSRRYAIIINGSGSVKTDPSTFGDLFGTMPHIGYGPVEGRIEDLIEAGVLQMREITIERRTKGQGVFLSEKNATS